MLGAIDIVEVNTEEWIRDNLPGGERRVRKRDVDDKSGGNGEKDVPFQEVESNECFVDGDYTVAVQIEEVTMLL